ncbi:hypothetical protein ROHU_010339 [Labeo rohita]|uniref:Uncharacterized protein n=1 Tax=Labeo rohita TaxID=84645 RepID=A0A498LYR1_LABRO|nr:hypothetical protein ROHU_010339 [Labeo rohita]
MASVEQDCDTRDEPEERKHEEVQMSSSAHTEVSVNINAETGGTGHNKSQKWQRNTPKIKVQSYQCYS